MLKNEPAHNDLNLALRAMRRVFVVAGVYSFIINALLLVPSVYSLQVFDRVLSSRSEMTLLMVSLIALYLYAMMGGIEWVRSQLMIKAGLRLDERLRDRVFNACHQATLRGAGGNPVQAINDLGNIRQFFTGSGLFAFLDAPWAPIFLVVIYMLHPTLGNVALGGSILLVILTLLTERITQKPLDEANGAAIQANNFATNNLRNAEVIEAMGMLPSMRARWFQKHHRMLAMQQVASNRAGLITAITKTCRYGLQSATMGVGAYLVITDQLTAGAMFASSILIGRAMAPVEQLIGAWKGLISVRSSYGRLGKLLDTFPDRPPDMSLPRPKGALSVEGVIATAPGLQTPILRGISFNAAPGEAICIIGRSASGKSTLARLLVGLWPAMQGKVRLDGADIAGWNKAELGPHLGYLPQDVELFEGSVSENIARFAEIDAEAVVQAAERAGVHQMILRLPQGYETQIGPGGGFLSGGQRQRVALARALYGKPALVVLDEPNSNLDDEGDAALLKAVQDLKTQGSTVILITHRTAITSAVDKLLVLSDGAVQHFGPRDAVLAAMNRPAQGASPPPHSPPTPPPAPATSAAPRPTQTLPPNAAQIAARAAAEATARAAQAAAAGTTLPPRIESIIGS